MSGGEEEWKELEEWEEWEELEELKKEEIGHCWVVFGFIRIFFIVLTTHFK